MTTRRLLADTDTNMRALYKHLALIARILLRADGTDFDYAEDALAAFCSLHPAAACAPPQLDSVIRHPRSPAVHGHLVEAADRLLAYIDQLGKTGVPAHDRHSRPPALPGPPGPPPERDT